MNPFIKEPVCDTVDDDNDNRLTHFKTPLRYAQAE